MNCNTSRKISRILSAIDQAMDERQGGVVQALRDLETVCELPHGYICATLREALSDGVDYFGDICWYDEDIEGVLGFYDIHPLVPNSVELVRAELDKDYGFTDHMIEAGFSFIYDTIERMRGVLTGSSDA